MQDVRAGIRGCTACGLHRTRKNAVPWSGMVPSPVVIVGEAPGREEDERGVPFVGAAGKLLNRLLATVGLDRSKVCVFNVVCCRPPDNRTPDPEEVTACDVWFKKQLELANPDLIITLGRTALSKFRDGSITELHGKPFLWEYRIVFPTYHPAATFRDGSRLQAMCADFIELRKLDQVEFMMKEVFKRIASAYPDGCGLASSPVWNAFEDRIDRAETMAELRAALAEYEKKSVALFDAWRRSAGE